MDNGIFDLMESHDYENIIFCQEKTLGLRAIWRGQMCDSRRPQT